MIARMGLALAVAMAVMGMAATSHAQCGSGGGGGARSSSGSTSQSAGLVAGGVTSPAAQAMNAANLVNTTSALQSQFQGAQTQYLAGMYAQHNAMLQQMHQRQYLQMQAMRQASQNKKRNAERVNASDQGKSRSSKSGPSA